MPYVALVDIDGCLVVNGKLNPAVVKQLREGGYDEIILFTQRSKFLQIGQISRAYLLGVPPEAGVIVTTPDAVAALEQELGKTIRVSTSVDQFFGGATEYYGAKDGLAEFESDIKAESSSKGMDAQLSPFNLQATIEAEFIREKLRSDPNLGENLQLDADTRDTAALYPKGKVKQYQHLLEGLPTILSVENLNDTTIDFFDDRAGNLNEVFYDKHVIKPPNRLMVVGDTIFKNIELGEAAAPALEKAKRITETIQGHSENIQKLELIQRSFADFELPDAAEKQQVALTIFTNYLTNQGVIDKPAELTKESVHQSCVSRLVADQFTQWNKTTDNEPLIKVALESLPLSTVNQLIDSAPIKKVQKNQIRHEMLDYQLKNLYKLHQDQSQLHDADQTKQAALNTIGGLKNVMMSTQWNTGLGGEKVIDRDTGQMHRVPKHMAEILDVCQDVHDGKKDPVTALGEIEDIAAKAADKRSLFRDARTQQAYTFFKEKAEDRGEQEETVKHYPGPGNARGGDS